MKIFLGLLFLFWLEFFLRILPLTIALKIGEIGGWFSYYFFARKEAKASLKNLTFVFGKEKTKSEIKRIAISTFKNLGKSAIEIFKIPKVSQDYIKKRVKIVGLKNLKEAYAQARGVIGITSHLGNWELLGAIISQLGYPLRAISGLFVNPEMTRYIQRYRQRNKIQPISRGFAVREVFKVLRKGKVVGVIIDAFSGKKKIRINFLGKSLYVHSGYIEIAQKTHSPILPVFIIRELNGFHRVIIEPYFEPSLDKGKDVKKCFQIVEKYVKEYPEQWLWYVNRWERE
jgi:KDO2-lipid IV(A) lauroyltransferase